MPHVFQLGQAGIGSSRYSEVSSCGGCSARESVQAVVADLRAAAEVQRSQIHHAFQVLQPVIADVFEQQRERFQVRQPVEGGRPAVGDIAAAKSQRLQVAQRRERFQPGVGKLRVLPAPASSTVQAPEAPDAVVMDVGPPKRKFAQASQPTQEPYVGVGRGTNPRGRRPRPALGRRIWTLPPSDSTRRIVALRRRRARRALKPRFRGELVNNVVGLCPTK